MIFSELKRRNVLREVGAYSVIAWLLLQVADVLLDPFNPAPWIMSALTYLALFGVVAAFVFAWRYDMTAHGIVRTAPRGDGAPEKAVSAADYSLMAALAVTVVVASYSMSTALQQPDRSPPDNMAANGIAVLPFLNLNNDPDFDYFSDGIADTVLHMLAQIPQLKVTARTSSFRYRNANADIRTIGRELGVGNVLEGSVQFAGNRIRVIAQLIDARDGTHRWSKTFDAETSDVFRVQDEIASEVAAAMESSVGGGLSGTPKHSTSNIDAYREYLLGVQARNLDSIDAERRAVEHFERAIELDPNYVSAYVALADVLLDPRFHRGSKKEVFDRVDRAIDAALTIDPNSGDALASKGVRLQWSGRTEEAEHYIDLALKNNADPLKVYASWGWLLRHHERRFEEALAMAKKAVELDPLSRVTIRQLGDAYMSLGDSVNAVQQYLELVELYPDYARVHESLSDVAMMEDRLDSAVRFMRRASDLEPTNSRFHERLAGLLLDLGDYDGALNEIEIATEMNKESWYVGLLRMFYHVEVGELAEAEVIVNDWFATNPWWLARATGAQLLAELGRYDEALQHLEIALEFRFGPDLDHVDRESLYWAIQYADLLARTGGDQEKIDALLSEALRVSQSFPATTTDATAVYIYLAWGRNEEALDELERQVNAGWRGPQSSLLLPKWQHDPFAVLRGDPRFENLAKIVLDDVARMRASLEERPTLDESDYAFRLE